MPSATINWAQTYEQARLRDVSRVAPVLQAGDHQVDQLVRLAADLFDVPVALVSRVDEGDVAFAVAHGIEEAQAPRDATFCARTIECADTMIVEDAHEDGRFADSPMVTGPPYIGFYAGAVLRGPNGYPFGTLCLIDYAPRQFRERDVRQLLRIARVVEAQIVAGSQPEQSSPSSERNLIRDAETGLLKRRFFEVRLDNLLAGETHPQVSVVSVHLENLAELRAAFDADHIQGIIAGLAKRLIAGLPAQVTGARWDTAEYVFMAPSTVPGCSPRELAQTVAHLLDEPTTGAGARLRVHASVGTAHSPEGGARAATLIDLARSAGRQHADERQGNVTIAAGSSQAGIQRRLALTQRFHAALEEGRIVAWFQPQVELASGRVCGAEALARWRDPELGDVDPEHFVALAESMGSVADLGATMLDHVCLALAAWQGGSAGDLPIALNATAGEVADASWVGRVEAALDRYSIAGEQLRIEITESALVADVEAARSHMERLAARGVRFGVDDFGSGYSSLQHLRNLPLHELKIDRALVAALPQDANAAAIVRAIVAMGQALQLAVVAEGVETAEQAELLRETGCTAAQGFYYALPTQPDDFVSRVAALR